MLTRAPCTWNVEALSSAESKVLGPLHEGIEMRAILSALAGGAFAALATLSAPSHAEQAGLYFGADVGLFDFDLPGELSRLEACDNGSCGNIASPTYDDTNFRLSGVVGMGVTEMLRVEAEAFFDIDTASGSEQQSHGLSASVSGDVRTYGVMLNSWVDLGAGTTWGLYAGGGVGMLFADTSYRILDRAQIALQGGGDDSDTEFAYQIGLGVHFQGWHAGYRFIKTGDLDNYGDVTQHVLMVGLRMW